MKFNMLILLLVIFYQPVYSDTPDQALISACKQGNLSMVQQALSKGADANAMDENKNSALSYAFFSPEITALLIEKGADVNAGNYPPIIQAANNYSTAVMDILLQAGADVNKAGFIKSPQMEKIYQMMRDMEKNIENSKGKTKKVYEDALATMKQQYGSSNDPGLEVHAINLVVQATNCVPCLEKLIAAGAKTDLEKANSLVHVYAVYGMTADQRKSAFENGKGTLETMGIKTPQWYGNLPSNINGSPEQILTILLKSGLKINTADAQGRTALHKALGGGLGNKEEIILSLLKNGADFKIEDPINGMCLTLAARTGSITIVEYMLSHGADIGETSKFYDVNQGQRLNGATPLVTAAMYGKLEMVKFLVSKGASIKEDAEGFSYNAKTGCATGVKNKSAIYFAIDNQDMNMVQYMVEESKLNWYRPLKINQLKQTSTSEFGHLSITTTSCFKDGTYKPSAYAAKMGQPDLAKYLKKNKL